MIDRYRRLAATGASCLFLLAGCGQQSPVFHSGEAPGRLSEWQLFELEAGSLTPSAETLVFRPASTLFTDYAQKLRTLWIPAGSQASLDSGELVYPVGTVLSKTFYYPSESGSRVRKQPDLQQTAIDLDASLVLETRLLVKQASGWQALPYVWNAEESEAFLRIAGNSKALNLLSETDEQAFTYFVPNQNQCSGCHQTEHPDGDMHPLGARSAQLLSAFPGSAESETQLAALQARGWLASNPEAIAETAAVDWTDEGLELTARASAYLNMNCGHCHNPEGAADTSALILDGSASNRAQLGLCKPPVAAGGGAGNLLYGIVPGQPEESILHYRMASTAPDEMMPELGRALVHEEGLALISDWIAAMPGNCD